MDQKLRFIEARLDKGNHYSMTELCRQFGVSRKTGHKWWQRFTERGLLGLAELSRAAQTHPNATPEAVVLLVISARRKHPTWGPRKLHAWLRGRGHDSVPSISTIGRILRREGLARRRRTKRSCGEHAVGLSAQDQPNAVWAADFKGQFRLTTGTKCYPLTISDGFSRFLLRCTALGHPNGPDTRSAFEAAFHEFGLPAVIRTDNGSPFSSPSGISQLSLWWIKLGIVPERIQRGKPTQNGRHERIHRTLKAEAIGHGKTKGSLWAQQRVFDYFRLEYNEERPHEALEDQTPASFYECSDRTYPRQLREPEYGDGFEVQRADRDGAIQIAGKSFRLSKLLAKEPVGIFEQAGELEVHYGPLLLATISKTGRMRRGRRKNKPDAKRVTPESGGENVDPGGKNAGGELTPTETTAAKRTT